MECLQTLNTSVDDEALKLSVLPSLAENMILTSHFSMSKVSMTLRSFDASKCCGPDGILPRFYKKTATYLARLIAIIVNKSLDAEVKNLGVILNLALLQSTARYRQW